MLLDQLLKNPRLELIGCCNELNASYAAEGHARSNGIGAFVVTYSVGGLSALNAVACAYAEDLPVVAVVGAINSDSEAEGRLIHHALGEVRYDYQRQIYAQVTAEAFAVRQTGRSKEAWAGPEASGRMVEPSGRGAVGHHGRQEGGDGGQAIEPRKRGWRCDVPSSLPKRGLPCPTSSDGTF